jgi:hypothetical protein
MEGMAPMSSNPSLSAGLVNQLAVFVSDRAREVGVTEGQILQLLGFRSGMGPLETLLSGRPASETIPEIAMGIKEGTDEVIKLTKAQVGQAIPMMVMDEFKPILRKMTLLNADGLGHLDVYLNFLMAQGFIKK